MAYKLIEGLKPAVFLQSREQMKSESGVLTHCQKCKMTKSFGSVKNEEYNIMKSMATIECCRGEFQNSENSSGSFVSTAVVFILMGFKQFIIKYPKILLE